MIKRFLDTVFGTTNETPAAGPEPGAAAAALLIEAARSDGHFDDDEKNVILRVLHEKLNSADPNADFEAGLRLQERAVDLFAFAKPLKEAYEQPARIILIEALWEVIYADGRRDRHEDSIVRRLLPLLGVTDQESGAARRRVTGNAPNGDHNAS